MTKAVTVGDVSVFERIERETLTNVDIVCFLDAVAEGNVREARLWQHAMQLTADRLVEYCQRRASEER